ncbi:Utp20p Ecym_5291 [Eremothecium cymbalariae DBVPG|uniref:Uncharacterized protein n=1 Tax=Eremothecium cymbalariae (strain CBS 270.75 / DBVPG 7215 / KCTC 17166 / NRRL Y-17582) TaxID=931890 RepID=I6NDB1_ERECY|nr:hypothetical protein Ecym_5291 [Eremothecium cymbalariae DBVPG\
MAKQKTTTKSAKRYRYSSFKDKIDDLKIEPAKNLTTRAHDYVETSHLLSSFERWREFNLSGDFIEFADEIENLIQTLPQVLYHEKKIFNILMKHIEKHDDKSLQPLLDLLSQFCHDLGPDFLKFYDSCLSTLIRLLDDAIKFEKSDVFEWGFNCLAYIFKYLSRNLSQDLLPTFNLLFPLLSHKKDFMSRFAAEALSFLIRKTTAANLSIFVEYSFKKLSDLENKNFYEGLQALFSEALKSTSEALHSKCNTIIGVLLMVSLSDSQSAATISLVSDILMDILRHASAENAQPLYDTVIVTLEQFLNQHEDADLNKALKILSTLSFAESGRKVSDWNALTGSIQKVLNHSNNSNLSPDVTAFMFSIILRNSDVRTLTHFHKIMFEYYLEHFPLHFIEFFKFSLDLDKAKLCSFNGSRYIQRFVNTYGKAYPKKLALFFLDIGYKPDLLSRLNINIPEDFTNLLVEDLESFTDLDSENTQLEVYWRIILINRANLESTLFLVPLITKLLNSSNINDFTRDLLGNLLLTLHLKDREVIASLIKPLSEKFDEFGTSPIFTRSINRIFSSCENLNAIISDKFLYKVSKNLLLPGKSNRYESLKLIISVLNTFGREVPQLINDLMLIEDIPLDLSNGRDLTLRLRKIGSDFAKLEPDHLICSVFFNHIFGLLTVRFSPIWDGINEILPRIFEKNQNLVWEICLHFINVLDNNPSLHYIDTPLTDDNREPFWVVSVNRLNDVVQAADKVFDAYFFTDASLVDMTIKGRESLEYPGMIRNQALKILLLLPGLAERHSRELVPFLLNQEDSVDVIDHKADSIMKEAIQTSASWCETDRNLLMKLVGKFRNIKAVYKSEELHQRLLILLGSRTTDAQKLSFEALLAYKEPVVVKYKDNLKNLLDDTLFKDEIIKLLAKDESRIIEAADEESLMPFVLRILFGRVQTPNTSGINKSRKIAVITVLPNLGEKYIIQFLALGSQRFNYNYFFENENQIKSTEATSVTLRRMAGFVNVVASSLSALGSKFPGAIRTVINPLIYTMCLSNFVIDHNTTENYVYKVAANVRQQGMKCFYELFCHVGEIIDWTEFIPNIHNYVIKPRIPKFKDENLQQPSSMMKLISYWSRSKKLYPLLYYNNYSCVYAFTEVLSSTINAQDSVVKVILEFFDRVVKNPTSENEYIELISIIVSTSLHVLPTLLTTLQDQNTVSTAISLLLNITEAGYIQDNDTTKLLIDALSLVLEKDISNVKTPDKIKLFNCLAYLVESYDCSWCDIENLYISCSKFYRTFVDRNLREALNKVLSSIGSRFVEVGPTVKLLNDLNSYSASRMQEYDFERILPAFKCFNEEQYLRFNETQWLPVLYCMLFFINDKAELVIRTNATYSLTRFIDYTNIKIAEQNTEKCMSMIKEIILPNLKLGLRKSSEEIQNEYIAVLAYIVTHSKFFNELEDMKCLLFNGDEEANFFKNINHIQLHRRQRAIKRLSECANMLSENSVSHYLMPMVERYIFCDDERYRNICNEAITCIGALSNSATWNQYKAILRRYISMLNTKPSHLKELVLVIVQVSNSFKNTMEHYRGINSTKQAIRKFPTKFQEPESYVKKEVYPILHKILGIRNEETIVARIPLSQALINLVLGLEYDDTVAHLSGILTSICQILRSRSEELRDAVRKNLSNISVILGPGYLNFVIRELKSALSRGSQVHVLSYTVHYLLMAMAGILKHGDLDGLAEMVVDIVMGDIFGSAGQEKDAEGYTSKMKEVKFNKSYDTGEILTANITLPVFGTLLRSIKALLSERLTLKNQRKLEELLRRYVLGLNHNDEGGSKDMLTLCYEIFQQSQLTLRDPTANGKNPSDKEEFFLVNLNSKVASVQTENSYYISTLQRFSLDLLKTAISRHPDLLDTAYLDGFVPLLKEGLLSENETVVISAMRILTIIIKLEFSEDSEKIFKSCARKVLNVIKDSPSTSSELCQVGLKFLSVLIRHKDISVKDTALDYVLGRIQPDLMEPSKQGLAFGFLKALLSKHIMLPKIYDIVDNVAEIMVTNHAKEIRDVARSAYYQFLMEYDQSRGRLEKQFKFLVNNLQYPSQEGRQSVMELLNLIINKSSPDLLLKLSSSFFVFLANVAVNDDSPKCRKMATLLLSGMFSRLGSSNMGTIEKYINSWLKQIDNPTFINLGLKIYKIYLSELPFEDTSLHRTAISRIKSVVSNTDVGSDSKWDDVYTALETFAIFAEKRKDEVYGNGYSTMWDSIIGCLLYPHEWVRSSSARLINILLSNTGLLETPLDDYKIQTIAYRLFRVLGSPSSSKEVGSKQVCVKILVHIVQSWAKNKTPYIYKADGEGNKYLNAIEFAIVRTSSIIRSEENPTDSYASKIASIQLLAMILQILTVEEVIESAEKFILPLYIYVEDTSNSNSSVEEEELRVKAHECMEMLENKLSVSDFTKAYTAVKQIVIRRRQERKAKRALLAVRAPSLAAERKLKKHARSRDKRKHEKDENGYYQRKIKK